MNVIDNKISYLMLLILSITMTCAILNADYKLGVPGTDRDLVNNLIQNKILPTEMKEILGSMKGFRNMVQTQ
ncbi:HepT-like ribonuclease domain-containing protein [Methanohalobium sp.]|uniref:HepT-like ribonuclease domain-containing protein n=1 Tax=Methanohalobium sp. TaxID=2837493 RepID=UPI003182F874